MPESLLNRRLKLGRYLGIDLFVHWSFGLVIAYVAFFSRDLGLGGVAFAVAQLLGVFMCVTLHEYGHAMAARRFGIATADITLLPIGGVARLNHMPRIPWQELIIAVAGPAVNVVIAALLLTGFFLLVDPNPITEVMRFFVAPFFGFETDDRSLEAVNHLFSAPSVAGFAVMMLIVNVMLVVFNMIPAFPMDGGRVFRSLLAMGIDYRRATRIASTVGLGCAGLLAFSALSADPPRWIPVMIAAFVGYAGMAEARQVEVMESVRGLSVQDVMIYTTDSLPMNMPLGRVVQRWQSTSLPAMPVLSIVGSVVGMLHLNDVRRAVATEQDLQTPAGQLIDHQEPVVTVNQRDSLEYAIKRAGRGRRLIPVVDDLDQLCGLIDLESMIARSEITKLIRVESINAGLITAGPTEMQNRFDQTT